MQKQTTSDLRVIIGLGITGLSCARYLAAKHIPFIVTDSRPEPPCLTEFQDEFPDTELHLGGFSASLLLNAKELIVSPGVSLAEPTIAACINKGIPAIGDIELFAREAKAPVVAITGTNAKGTVTTLVGEMAKAAGKNVRVGGNIGIPVLELLQQHEPDLYVLEISSYQLETTFSLNAAAATILNLSEDHLDRYHTMQAYQAAKQRVYHQCESAIYNRDDNYTFPLNVAENTVQINFGMDKAEGNNFGLIKKDDETWLAQGNQLILPVTELQIHGVHNWINALAALAIGYSINLPMDAMINALKIFQGLPHRCQFVREIKGVNYYNDSKGTNVGATLAAINSLGQTNKGKLILIAGGLGKNADFSPLRPAVANYVRSVVLIGKDAPILENTLKDITQCINEDTMKNAVIHAQQIAQPNDAILLSPACASLDMFNDYEHRGEVFAQIVKELE